MGRRSSGGFGGRRRRSASPPPTPVSRSTPPSQQEQRPGLFSGLASTVVQGAAFGTGSAMAHRAVDAMTGGGRHEAPVEDPGQVPVEDALQFSTEGAACQHQSKAFTDCITANNGEMAACQYYFDMLQQCKAGM